MLETAIDNSPSAETAISDPLDQALTHAFDSFDQRAGSRLDIDPKKVEEGLARLVLTVVEFLRQLLERQAIARMEAGSLTHEQIENVGLALMRLEEKVRELRTFFGLGDEELNLDLGPLGRLM